MTDRRTIWKFELRVTDTQKISMPEGAEILHVTGQNINNHLDVVRPMLWARVDPDAPMAKRLIAVCGTGNPCPGPNDGWHYAGTAICPPFVWHVFDGGEVVESDVPLDFQGVRPVGGTVLDAPTGGRL